MPGSVNLGLCGAGQVDLVSRDLFSSWLTLELGKAYLSGLLRMSLASLGRHDSLASDTRSEINDLLTSSKVDFAKVPRKAVDKWEWETQ